MITCASCNAELPDSAEFCSSCGKPVEHEADLKAPSDVTRDWLIAVFNSDGYECEEDNDEANAFFAKHPTRYNIFVNLRPQLITIGLILRLHRHRKDEAALQAAINRFNSENVLWIAYPFREDAMGFSTFFTLSARTSARAITQFLELADTGVVQAVQSSGLMKHME